MRAVRAVRACPPAYPTSKTAVDNRNKTCAPRSKRGNGNAHSLFLLFFASTFLKMWERRHFLLFFLVALSLTLFIYLSPLYSQLQLSSSPSPFSSSSSSPSPTASRQTTTGRGEWRNTCLLTVTTKQNNTCVDGGTRRHEVALASGAACSGQALTSADHQVVASHMFSEAELREQFTVVILTMAKRVKMLNRVLREYDGLPAIAEIIVVMNGLNESHVSSRLGVTKTPISFVNNSINSLNIR
jgi:hypothetical protein